MQADEVAVLHRPAKAVMDVVDAGGELHADEQGPGRRPDGLRTDVKTEYTCAARTERGRCVPGLFFAREDQLHHEPVLAVAAHGVLAVDQLAASILEVRDRLGFAAGSARRLE